MSWLIELIDVTITHLVNLVMIPLSFEVYGVSGLDLIGILGVIVLFVWTLKLIRG